MAATIGTLTMRGRQSGRRYTLSVYNPAAGAAGTYVLMDWNAPASANSPNFFTVPEVVDCIDFIPTAATGTIEFTSDGMRTAAIADYSAFGATNPSRPVGSLPSLAPGKTYRMLVVAALAA